MTHDSALQANPGADYQSKAGELIAVMGNVEQPADFQALISPPQ
ncbi:hypothetical protein [uncultured Desulfobacter sp.]|nr:hypothetical protein [uncultured Desulfobacter sp.]